MKNAFIILIMSVILPSMTFEISQDKSIIKWKGSKSTGSYHDGHILIENGIRPHITLILATPECNLEDIEITLTKALKYFKLDEVQGSINPGVFPLKGSEFYEQNTNFKSRVIQIPNTEHFIKKDDLILFEVDGLFSHFGVFVGNDQFWHHEGMFISRKNYLDSQYMERIHSIYRLN